MKKIGIITMEAQNFGNRLQNYALQEVLRKQGYSVETIRRSDVLSLPKRIKASLKQLVQDALGTKGAKFRAFDRAIIHSSYRVTKQFVSADIASRFSYFIAGSDQIWNPYYRFLGEAEWLTFANQGQRIAYAGSFGVPELPEEKTDVYTKWINQMDAISVREEAGARIIEKLTGKKVPVVLDPTLLLTADEWRKIEKKPKGFREDPYILVYYVESAGKELREACEKAKQSGKRIVNARQVMENGREWAVGPAEFVYLIDHAAKVYTDSFHGTVFSILFHKEFQVFHRDGIDMSSRIDTLLKSLSLSDNLDYELAEKALERERERSLAYLQYALEG